MQNHTSHVRSKIKRRAILRAILLLAVLVAVSSVLFAIGEIPKIVSISVFSFLTLLAILCWGYDMHVYKKCRGYEVDGSEYLEAVSKYTGELVLKGNAVFGSFFVGIIILVLVMPIWAIVISALATLVLYLVSPLVGHELGVIGHAVVVVLSHVSAVAIGYSMFKSRAKVRV